jgi:hypothetical protein
MIRIAILGSTGSIGKSALKVIERHPERFQVVGLAANRSAEALARQVARHRPRVAVLANEPALSAGAAYFDDGVCLGGRDALLALAESPDVDVVINALVGAAGLEPTLRALENGKAGRAREQGVARRRRFARAGGGGTRARRADPHRQRAQRDPSVPRGVQSGVDLEGRPHGVRRARSGVGPGASSDGGPA